jgi:hypothetical protein
LRLAATPNPKNKKQKRAMKCIITMGRAEEDGTNVLTWDETTVYKERRSNTAVIKACIPFGNLLFFKVHTA